LNKCTSDDIRRLGREGDPHSGRSLLHVMCNQGFIRNTEAVLEHAKQSNKFKDIIEVRAADGDAYKSWTPLFFAVVSGPNGHPEIVNLLLRNAADANARDSLGRTPLHYASELGQDDSLEMLLNHGADPNVQDTASKKTALLLAIENG